MCVGLGWLWLVGLVRLVVGWFGGLVVGWFGLVPLVGLVCWFGLVCWLGWFG